MPAVLTSADADVDLTVVAAFGERFKKLLHVGADRLVVGLGERSEHDAERARIAAAVAHDRAREGGARAVRLELPDGIAAGPFVEGVLLAAYRFDRFKSEPDDTPGVEQLIVAEDPGDAVALAEAQNAARDLSNAPANALTPVKLAARARELAAELGLECEVLGREQIRALGMGAFAAVAQGAAEEPQLITLRHRPPDAAGPVLGLVGKAVTFDTGGISIKPALNMRNMKHDMAGGAAVLAATAAIARMRLPVNVVAVIGATNNDVGSGAMKPGDIVRARSGTTIEITNTDAEGRLVLCDCLVHARDAGAERLVDVATLTGGIVTTFGNVHAGLFGTDDAWCDAVRDAGDRASEPLWRLPLGPEYADKVKGDWADLINANEDRKATSIVGAEFLRAFVGDVPWAHLDIAGVGWDRGRAYAAKGASGFGARTLIEVARSLAR